MGITDLLSYIFLFAAIYFEVFILLTFIEKRSLIKKEALDDCTNLPSYPTVTIMVPCYNEENTIKGTIDSLLALDYPKDKLKILIIDDGSKDSTWNVIQEFSYHEQIEVYRKENGGKHTALNFGLEKTVSELVGCLDADSFVHPLTLKKIVKVFQRDPEIMSVTPAIMIHKASTTIQTLQYIEYIFGILLKKIYGLLGAIHVTPGPFSIFRKKVFDDLGPYRKAHNTEDMELALRMHAHHYRIENCHTAWVYTVGPRTVRALYKQRVRWTHGFLENVIDYRHLFLSRKHGNLGLLTLPAAILSIVGFLTLLSLALINFAREFYEKTVQWRAVGFVFKWPTFDFHWFYLNTKTPFLLTSLLFILTLTLIFVAKKMVEGNMWPSKSIVLLIILYPIISPFWLLKSVYNTVFSRNTSWR